MNPDKLFSLLSPKQVLSQESQQAYQSKVDTAKAENKMIKEKVVNPFFSFADKSFKKIMEVLNPGESYVAPALKNIGVNPILAGGIGLGVDILAPGPGELGRVAKVGKEVKAGSELLQEAKKYKSADEFVANYKNNSKIQAIVHAGDTPETVKIKDLFLSEDAGTAKLGFGKGIESKNLTAGRSVNEPVLVLGRDTVIDGHTRIQQAIANGEDSVKIYRVKPVNEVKSQLTEIWNKAHKEVKPSVVEPLIEEAKKYKSAEEFVRDAIDGYLQGSSGPMEVQWGSAVPFKGEIPYTGLPTTVDPSIAKRFSNYHGGMGGTINKAWVKPNAKIIKFEELPNSFRSEEGMDAIEQASRWAKRNGYDGIDMRGTAKNPNTEAEIRIFNKDVLEFDKNKLQSQLTEIWNKAHKEVKPSVVEPLEQEAKKYKTAEEFIKAQPIVYHGSNSPIKRFDNKKGGVFFTDDMFNADGYAGGENVYEGVLNLKNPLVIDAKGRFHNDLKTKYGTDTTEIVGKVDQNKYDGVIFKNIKDSWIDDADVDTPSTIYYSFRPEDSFLNESQLTEIWQKANKTK